MQVWYHAEVRPAEALWMKIIGVLLILLGLVLLASPQITYSTRERVVHTGSIDVSARRQKTVVVPRIFSLLTIGGGVAVLVLARRKSR